MVYASDSGGSWIIPAECTIATLQAARTCNLNELDLNRSVASLIALTSSPVGGFLGFPPRSWWGSPSTSIDTPVPSHSSSSPSVPSSPASLASSGPFASNAECPSSGSATSSLSLPEFSTACTPFSCSASGVNCLFYILGLVQIER